MTREELRKSLLLWKTRERGAKDRHTAALKRGDREAVKRHGDRLREARKMVERRTNQLEQLDGYAPRIITSRELGLKFQYVFGTKGAVYRGAGHYTAGHRAKDAAALKAEMLTDHRFHAGKGWGGLSYEAMVADDGTIGLGNPIDRKSAAVASNNTGMVNVCCPGTTGDRMTGKQRESVAWLLENWHTAKIPAAYRLDRDARKLDWRGHHEFSGQSTACPGAMLQDYKGVFRAG